MLTELDNNDLKSLPPSLINLDKINLLALKGNDNLQIDSIHEQWFDEIKARGGRVIL